MSNDPLVSVIVPVHNGARYLRAALDSALDQQYKAIEVIVVDDGSTDQTPEILGTYGERIIAIRQENAGAASARNSAIQAARGEIIAFLDADDLWLPHKLTTQIDFLNTHPSVDLVASRWEVLANDAGTMELGGSPTSATVTDASFPLSGWLYVELLLDCVIHTTTVVMRRRLVDKIGVFDGTLRRGQDYDYWLRASRVTQIHSVAAPLSLYRLHATNNTWRPQPFNYGAIVLERALRTWGREGPDGRFAPLAAVSRRLSGLWFSFGVQHLSRGSVAIAIRAALRSVVAWPLAFKPWFLLAACAAAPFRRRSSRD